MAGEATVEELDVEINMAVDSAAKVRALATRCPEWEYSERCPRFLQSRTAS